MKVLPVPSFGYSPETRTYVGAVALFTFKLYADTATRTSNAKLEFNYTWNKQVIVEAGWNYFFDHEVWFTKGTAQYSKYPDLYYGIGQNTPDEGKLIYNSNRMVLEAFGLRNIGNHIFVGPNVRYINYSKVGWGNDTVTYPELVDASSTGIGISVLKDSRNSLLTPITGIFAYGNATYNIASGNYVKLTLDLRYYKTWKEKHTLALRFINEFNTGKPPFYDYAFLGGDKYVRGYYYGRFRDNGLSSLQTEYRFPIIWRIGLAAFGGLSGIYSSLSDLGIESLKYNYGLGLRFLIDRKEGINLRLDYAIGKQNNYGFYISFGESF